MNRRGQSTLEYALILGAILIALVGLATTIIAPAVTNSMTTSAGAMTGATGKLQSELGLGKEGTR